MFSNAHVLFATLHMTNSVIAKSCTPRLNPHRQLGNTLHPHVYYEPYKAGMQLDGDYKTHREKDYKTASIEDTLQVPDTCTPHNRKIA